MEPIDRRQQLTDLLLGHFDPEEYKQNHDSFYEQLLEAGDDQLARMQAVGLLVGAGSIVDINGHGVVVVGDGEIEMGLLELFKQDNYAIRDDNCIFYVDPLADGRALHVYGEIPLCDSCGQDWAYLATQYINHFTRTAGLPLYGIVAVSEPGLFNPTLTARANILNLGLLGDIDGIPQHPALRESDPIFFNYFTVTPECHHCYEATKTAVVVETELVDLRRHR